MQISGSEDEASPDMLSKQVHYKAKTRKFDDTYLDFGFTCTTMGNEERPGGGGTEIFLCTKGGPSRESLGNTGLCELPLTQKAPN